MFFVLTLMFFLSVVFMLFGVFQISKEGYDWFQIVFTTAGFGLFIIFLRGAWINVGRPVTHILTIDEQEVQWCFLGKEKILPVNEIKEFYWSDGGEDFNFSILKTNGKRARFPYIENVVSFKDRPKLFRFLKETHPNIPITGYIDPETEQDACSCREAGARGTVKL